MRRMMSHQWAQMPKTHSVRAQLRYIITCTVRHVYEHIAGVLIISSQEHFRIVDNFSLSSIPTVSLTKSTLRDAQKVVF